MSLNRVVFSVHAIPVVATIFLFSIWWHDYSPVPLFIWAILYVIGAILTRSWKAHFQFDCDNFDQKQVVDKWIPRLNLVAALHGFALGLGTWVIALSQNTILSIFWMVSIAGILAINATHQTGVLSSFLRFYALCWGTLGLASFISTPDYAWLSIALELIFALALYHHAKKVHYFFVQQMQLEEKLQQAKEQAENALAAKNRFLMTASHDLRQPIHAMGFLIESLFGRNHDMQLQSTLIDLKSAGQAVQLMFDSILDLSRIERESEVVVFQIIDIQSIIYETRSLFASAASSKGLQFRIRVGRNVRYALSEPVLLRRALINLVQNALRYTFRGGVLVTVRKRDGKLRIQVCDTGIGVAGEDQQKIFSPLYRQEHAWDVANEGHGLGLAVVARCVELLGAEYGMQSRNGRGSIFWLDIASGTPPPHFSLNQSKEEKVAATPIGGRCLIVDDDPLVSSAWQHLLTAWGMEGRTVASGAEAFHTLEQGFRPDVIFCDQRLRSGESGAEVLEALFNLCPNASGAIISGELNSPELERAKEDGYIVLGKPLDSALLRKLLEQWVSNHSVT